MRLRRRLSRPVAAAAGIFTSLLLLAGCNEYDTRVEVARDGSGTRSIRLTIDRDTDSGKVLDAGTVQSLLSLEDRKVWKRVEGEQEGGSGRGVIADRAILDKETMTFVRDHKAATIDDWRKMSGDITVLGTYDEGEPYDVRLTNSIRLERAVSGGDTVLTYVERLEWTGVRERILDFVADKYVSDIRASVPDLSDVDEAGLKGLIKGHFSMLFDDLDDSEREEEMTGRISSSLFATTNEMLERSGRKIDPDTLRNTIDDIVYDRNGTFDELLEEKLPGLGLAFSTRLVLSVTLPGRITETNGEISEDGRTVTWKPGLLDPMVSPVEMKVSSRF